MDRRVLKVAMAAAITTLAVPLFAQESKPVGLSVRAGLIFPTSGYGRDVGRTWFGVGGEFKVRDMGFGTMDRGMASHLSVSLDWYGKGEASAVPLMLNWVGNQNQIYWSAGAGLAFTRDEETVGGVVRGRNRTNFGFTLGVGYNFQTGTNPFFVEGRFWGNSNSNLNALGAYVGVRL